MGRVSRDDVDRRVPSPVGIDDAATDRGRASGRNTLSS
ncbi:hypothetical protein SAMN05445060_1520 [Williamsia sterculiae]|uniref:Uncharacterized protein n=1 Tax=Williamsia sterculiae TaxID=1344003 RepID=A0A1N7EP42_9NOCA|nr:hypothetical protein SAMN05445060_1520 [Williamsia sterculiae]